MGDENDCCCLALCTYCVLESIREPPPSKPEPLSTNKMPAAVAMKVPPITEMHS